MPIFAPLMLRAPLLVMMLRLALVAVVYGGLRVLFCLANADLFPAPPPAAFLAGLRFDASAIAWTHLPWVLLVLMRPAAQGPWARAQFIVFMAVNALALFFNTVDIGYYPFTLKRSTADLLNIISAGGDTLGLAPAFLRDYPHLLLVYVAALVLLGWGYQRLGRQRGHGPVGWHGWAWRIIAIGLMVLASRGGLQLVPLQPMDAARAAGAAYMPVVLNTPFTMLMTLGKPTVEDRHYMAPEEADRLWPVIQQFAPAAQTTPPPNVAIIVLESFSASYSGELAGEAGYMPFLDSLMRESMYFTRAYANGRRSIDGIPAILASIPNLMDEAFITSTYAGLPFTSLASVLGPKGYATSFFHGGRNGTMGFDGFARSAGFQRYVGRNEYPDADADFDGHWGIRDRPFLQFWARSLDAEPRPFLSTVFTLSSHHPYELLPDDAERFGGGSLPIHATLRYTDDALRQFFATARTMNWYANTIFVITADHTADLERTGRHGDKPIDHWIPLVVHAPGRLAPDRIEDVVQQIDILPLVLQLAGHEAPFFSFGHSPLAPGPRYAVSASNGLYTIIGSQAQLVSDGTRTIEVRPLEGAAVDSTEVDRMERHLQAAVQQFNHYVRRGMRPPATP